MRVQIFYNLNAFEIEFDDFYNVDYTLENLIDWNCPIVAIMDLADSGNISVSSISKASKDCLTVVTKNNKVDKVYLNKDGKTTTFKSVFAALEALCKNETQLEENGMYRFIYDGGTRKGQKRAVKVLKLTSTYANCEDLDNGEARNYTLDKIRDVEEII